MEFLGVKNEKSTELWINMWIVIYILHSVIFYLSKFWQKGFLHVFDEISTSYPHFVDILCTMWISLLFLWKRCGLLFWAWLRYFYGI